MEMHHTLEILEDGGMGYRSDKKRNGWVRLMFENWNGVGILTQSWKLDHLNYLIGRLNVDIVAGCECQIDLNLLSPGKSKKGIAAHNKMRHINRDQMGGTAITRVGRICNIMKEVGLDVTGLGRWSWISLSNGTTTTHVVRAYLPWKPGCTSRSRTVWKKHSH